MEGNNAGNAGNQGNQAGNQAAGNQQPPAGMTQQEYANLIRAVRDEMVRANQARGRLKLELPSFSGAKTPLEAQAFLRDAEGYKEACGLDDAQAIQAVQFALRDEAKTWGANLALTRNLGTTTWVQYTNLFAERFGLTMSPSEKAKLVESLAQKSEESVRSFYDRCNSAELILSTGNPIYENRNVQDANAIREAGICDKFLRGLREAGDLKVFVNSLTPRVGQQAITLKDYYDAAIQKEQAIMDKKRICEVNELKEAQEGQQVEVISNNRGPDMSRVVCFRCRKIGHFARNCRLPPTGGATFQNNRGRGSFFRGRGGRGNFNSNFAFRGRGGNWGRPTFNRLGNGGNSNNVSALEAIQQATQALAEEEYWKEEEKQKEENSYEAPF